MIRGSTNITVRQCGAVGDGRTNEMAAIQKAIDRVHESGGGVVEVPPGDYMTGTIYLRSNVTLHIEAGATIWGSKRREDYVNPSSDLICAEDAVNVGIAGRGAIDGNGEAFWAKKEDGSWGIGDWRPGRMVRFVRCQNVLIEDVTFRNSPAWTIHPIDCVGVTIRGISILNGVTKEDHGPNTDGIDPDGCSRVRISDCYLQTGDDSIVLKITNLSQRKSCTDVVVTNCVMVSTCTALKIGSETHGEFRNVVFSNCTVENSGNGVGIWMRDGGSIDGFLMQNLSMNLTNGGVPIYFWAYRREEDAGSAGTVRNVMVTDVVATGDACAFISGSEEAWMEGVTLDNLRITMRGARDKTLHEDPPHPFTVWGYRRSPYDFFCRYVRDLKIRNVQVDWAKPEKPEWGSAVRVWHGENIEIDGFVGRQAQGSPAATVQLRDVRNAWLRHCRAQEGTGTFLDVDPCCKDITLMNCDLSRAEEAVAGEAEEVHIAGNRLPDSRPALDSIH